MDSRTDRSHRSMSGRDVARAFPFANAAMLTLMVGSLSIMGCAGGSGFFSSTQNTSAAPELGLDEQEQSRQATRDYVQKHAAENRMPKQYVAEARIGIAEIEQALAEARVSDIEHGANLDRGLARVSAQREQAAISEQSHLADAERLQKQYAAKQNELWGAISARERTLNSDVQQNRELIEALRKEREQVYEELTSRAWRDYDNAQAQIEKLKSIRNTTQQDGEAALEELRESAQATESRAVAMVANLRSKADSARDQANARANELEVRINTVSERTTAEARQLRSEADSVEQEGEAQFNELMARADALTEQGSQESYDLKVNAARTEFRQAKTEYERMIERAEANRERARAEVERLQSEAEEVGFIGESNFAFGVKELESWYEHELAEIDKLHAQSDRLEREARAEFVKAQAQAIANARRETSVHLSELAEATKKTIIAEAEAEAKRVRHKIMQEIVNRQRQNDPSMPGKTTEEQILPEDLHVVPMIPQVDQVMPRIEPEHIADFRSDLARVMQLRAEANAKTMALDATYEESNEQLRAVRDQYVAASKEKLAMAESMSTQAKAQFNDQRAQADAWLAVAEATYERSLADAESSRKEKTAEAAELRAEAKAVRDLALAHADLLRVEAQVRQNNGQSELRALQAALKSTRERGTAEFQRLWAEADSIEQSERAMTEQIHAQIAAAERVLKAELAKQDRNVESAIAVAEANYDEATVNAEVFARKSEVEIERLTARNEHQRALASAEIEHLRNLAHSTELKADAEVTRRVAAARALREKAEAFADAGTASLYAQHDIARADVIAQTRMAEAREGAVKANFDARLVQVQSERIRNLAEQYRDEFFHRTNLETSIAEAEAIQSQMNERFAAIRMEQDHMQRTAKRDWDARLATMQNRPRTQPQQPQFDLPSDLEEIQITNVPITRD